MNKITISVLTLCLIGSSFALPVAQEAKNEEAEPKTVTTPLVVDNDAMRRMYYERYLMQRDDSLQHSANTGGKFNVGLDYKIKSKRQTVNSAGYQEEPYKVEQPNVNEAKEEAPLIDHSDLGALLKSLNLKSTPVSEGAGYTRKRRATMEKEMQPPKTRNDNGLVPAQPDPEEDYGSYLESLNLPKTTVAEGAGYTLRKRSAMGNEQVNQEYRNVQPSPGVYAEAISSEPQTDHEEAPLIDHSGYGSLLKSLNLPKIAVSEGAGYTRRRRSAMGIEQVNQEYRNVQPSPGVYAEAISSVTQTAQEEAPLIDHSGYGSLLKSLNLPKIAVSEGAGYTRRRRSAMGIEQVNQEYHNVQPAAPGVYAEIVPNEPQTVKEEAPLIDHSGYGSLLKSLNLPKIAVSEGAGYTRRRRSPMEKDQDQDAETEAPKRVYNADEEKMEHDMAMYYMLQG